MKRLDATAAELGRPEDQLGVVEARSEAEAVLQTVGDPRRAARLGMGCGVPGLPLLRRLREARSLRDREAIRLPAVLQHRSEPVPVGCALR